MTLQESAESSLRRPEIYAFVGSACLLILELVAGRVVAPAVGFTLYTWTSVIGVVLAGISIGNILGGVIADRYPGRSTLSFLYLVSALAAGWTLFLTQQLGQVNAIARDITGGNLPFNTFLLVTVIFFPPALALGTQSPLLVKLSLPELQQTGRVVGRVQGAAALGSIVGTFATGFWLISWIGTRLTIASVGAVLLILAAASSSRWPPWRVAASLLLVGALVPLALRDASSPCLRESNYYCIDVYAPSAGQRILQLDDLSHGFVDLHRPSHLLFAYQRELGAYVDDFFAGRPIDALFLGGGGYTMPRHVLENSARSATVVEIDPAVTEVARARLALHPTTGLQIVHSDARAWLTHDAGDRRFDLIVGDAFDKMAVPFHLTTREFNDAVDAHLESEGLYAVNVIDRGTASFLASYVKTMQLAFDDVAVMPVDTELGAPGPRNYLVLASDASLPVVPSLIQSERVLSSLADARAVVLSDDFAPVDQLLW